MIDLSKLENRKDYVNNLNIELAEKLEENYNMPNNLGVIINKRHHYDRSDLF